MTSLFAAELLKLRTIRATWGFALAAIGFSGLLGAGHIGSPPEGGRVAPDYQLNLVLSAALPAVILSLLLGMLLFTNEFRHGTIARTLLVTPRRPIVVAIKVLVGAAAGLGLGLLAFAATSIAAVIGLRIVDVPLEPADVVNGLWRALVAAALIGAFGAAVGGLVHSQVGALVGTLVWLFVAEPIVWVLLGLVDLDGVADYLPAAIVFGILDTEGAGLSFGGTVGMAVAWTAFAATLAIWRTRRRDIT
jgi:ABC-2 type transport system permease protein